ncbi:MAG TPA: hypothetical protein VIK59_11400 [Verrucomicrobiae bacterium]
MKVKEKKQRAELPFDPVLFAATVPSRKPTTKDVADIKAHKEDLIEPQDYESMDDMVKDL